MKKGLKRLLAVLTAAVVAVGCATGAFAANENGKDGEKTKASQTEILPSTLSEHNLSASEEEKPPASQTAKGDVSGDGIVDIEDAMLVFYHVAKRELLDEARRETADTDLSGEVDISDAMMIFYSVAFGGNADHCHIFEEMLVLSTCTEAGSKTRTCLVCEKSVVSSLALAPHSYTVEEKAPTCEENGCLCKTCSVCGKTEETVLSAAGHLMKTETKAPTCEEDGEEVSICECCGFTVRKALKAHHSWKRGKTLSEPTEKREGQAEFECSVCGKTKTDDIPRLRGKGGEFKYFTQWDGRWSGVRFGDYTMGRNGCAPTSTAMALAFCGINVLPVDVANWLYKNTEEFCRTFSGSSGSAIRLAAEHYGAETTNIYEYSDLLAAFENNGTVCIAVGKGIFCNNGTHCIFLYGYDAESGKVNAADPWTRKMNDSYDLAEIWAERSTSPVDLRFDGCVAYGIR